jgi:hypothetical protein
MKRCLSTGNVDDSGDNFITITTKRSKKLNSLRNSASSSQPSTSVLNMDKIIDAVAHNNDPDCNELKRQHDLQLSINSLSAIVQQLQETIHRLATQLHFVLSFLGIDNVNGSLASSVVTPSTSADHMSAQSSDVGATSSANITLSLSSMPGGSVSYAAATSRGASTQQPVRRPMSVKEVILSTVYNEKIANNRRSNSIIVSGLVLDPNHSDTEVIGNLCYSEFGIRPAITSTKRLGKVIDGRIQPVLAVLKSSDTAREIITCAKSLRRSPDPAIRDLVYIIANLSREEARAAYDQRCRRRMVSTQQLNSDPTDSASNTLKGANVGNQHHRVIVNSQFRRQKIITDPPGDTDADLEDERSTQQYHHTVPASSLNAAVQSFVPAVSTSPSS